MVVQKETICYNVCTVTNKEYKMNQIQFIVDGYNQRAERVILWRLADYTYELEIGTGIHKKTTPLTNTEYYDALSAFDAAVESFDLVA